MYIRKGQIRWMLVLVLAATFLLVGCLANPMLAQEEQTESIRIGKISEIVGSIGSSEGMGKKTTINALKELSEDIAAELKEKEIPEETINQFNKEFNSALSLFQDGIINRSQFSREVSGITEGLGREVEALPVNLLEENGVNTEAIQKLKQGEESLSGPEVAEIARSISGKREEEEAKEKAKEMKEEAKEKKEEAQEKAEEMKEAATEKKQEAQEKAKEMKKEEAEEKKEMKEAVKEKKEEAQEKAEEKKEEEEGKKEGH